MLDDLEPFTEFEPGQLITAEAMNAMQAKMRSTILSEIAKAIAALTEIDRAKDSDALGGETSEDLLEKFLERAMQEFPSHTGYLKLFKILNFDERNVIAHGLKLCPLVDLYELIDFDVVCADDDEKHNERVRFFLYHSSEKKLRGPGGTVEIETTGEPPFRIPLASLLELLKVEYSDNSSLGDLETELWQAMFADPNDTFDPADYCHSPWYERCCREERTVGSLKEKGDWDELWLKMQPRKTVNPPPIQVPAGGEEVRYPRGVLVEHHDFDTLSLTLKEQILPPPGEDGNVGEPLPLCLMVLLKV